MKVIDLDEQTKGAILEAVSTANKENVEEFKSEFFLRTYNGLKFLKWDFTYNNIANFILKENRERFKVLDIKRGGWDLILLYDKYTNFIFSIMKEQRFEQLQNEHGKRKHNLKPHYIDALATIGEENLSNYDLTNFNEQIELLSTFKEWNEAIDRLLSKMLNEDVSSAVEHVHITFTVNRSDVTFVEASILTPNLTKVYTEDWSEFIPAIYNFDEQVDNINNTEDEDIELPLKESNFENHDDEVELPLKDYEQEKEKK